MRKNFFSAAVVMSLFAGSAVAENPLIGVVNFTACITDSKYGKKEQENLENLRKQMSSLIENTEKELKEISAKFEDTEYLDSLSPKAEEELKVKFQTLQEDLSRYQNQFYQVLNHANYQMIQKISGSISSAAEGVAKTKNLDYVMNKEACFYIRPDLDVTSSVITEMDKNFELDSKAKNLSGNSEEAPFQLNDKGEFDFNAKDLSGNVEEAPLINDKAEIDPKAKNLSGNSEDAPQINAVEETTLDKAG